MNKNQKEIERLLRRAKKIMSQIDSVKPLYSELDDILLTLAVKFKFRGNDKFSIQDQFKNKNTAFKTVSMSRYRLEILK